MALPARVAAACQSFAELQPAGSPPQQALACGSLRKSIANTVVFPTERVVSARQLASHVDSGNSAVNHRPFSWAELPAFERWLSIITRRPICALQAKILARTYSARALRG